MQILDSPSEGKYAKFQIILWGDERHVMDRLSKKLHMPE
jgi:hypothetical protein